jgi:hypothetical protein
MQAGLRGWIGILVVAALTACASGPAPVGRRDLLAFLKPGTPRSEIVLKLGPPFASFEGERIMAWSIGEDAGGYVVGATDYRPGALHDFTRYELVVVFDVGGGAVEHRLVEVHKPR